MEHECILCCFHQGNNKDKGVCLQPWVLVFDQISIFSWEYPFLHLTAGS